ncbi:MAG: general secretion pathway protein GspG [Deltaproteobacteria bacterium]|nr:general secretion pathway protein GspG [Deltaproteobacteria bacterium]
MVVITIIGILAGIAVPMYRNSVIRAKEATLKEDLFLMRESIDKYYADRGEYPPALQEIASKKYIRTVPIDPFTGLDKWGEVPPDEGAGVFDVRSLSAAVGSNGIPYNEW